MSSFVHEEASIGAGVNAITTPPASAVDAVNHVAIIVHDVGRSASFYADILGLQQIKRPNFDRHGAWFTAGNVELHLIKGEPLIYPRDGEVKRMGRVGLGASDPGRAFELLRAMEGVEGLEMHKDDSPGGAPAVFFRDPDGYIVELIRCPVEDVLVPTHWNAKDERRGLGDLVTCMSHVALVCSEIGRSAAFYTRSLGLTSLDDWNAAVGSHGGPDVHWLLAGNMKVLLVHGEPVVHNGENLIVGHIALDTHRPAGVFAGLQALGIDLEMNVSVPKGTGKAASEGGSADNTLSQAFFRDPDGHYLEACNCHLLTSFCLGPAEGEEEDDDGFRYHLLQYEEGIRVPGSLTSSCAKLLIKASRAKKRNDHAAEAQALPVEEQPEVADATMLANLIRRRTVYGDLCQSFEPDEIAKILRESGNHAPTALLLMEQKIERGHTRVVRPPGYYVRKADAGEKQSLFTPQPVSFQADAGEEQSSLMSKPVNASPSAA